MSDHGYVGGGPPPPIAGDTASFPSDAELARTLAAGAVRATLSTLTEDGFPFGSVVSIVVGADGEPVMCISALAEHTINARRDPRASVLITDPVPDGTDPLAAARLTLVGTLVEQADLSEGVRDCYLGSHPGAAGYIGYCDLSSWSLVPSSVRFVGGVGICGQMNDDLAAANLLYAQRLAGLPDASAATMTAVDRHGFTLRVTARRRPVVSRPAMTAPHRGRSDRRRRPAGDPGTAGTSPSMR